MKAKKRIAPVDPPAPKFVLVPAEVHTKMLLFLMQQPMVHLYASLMACKEAP